MTLFALIVALLSSSAPSWAKTIVVRELDTHVVEAILASHAQTPPMALPQDIEVARGKSKGYRYTVTLKSLTVEKLFEPNTARRFRLGVMDGGIVNFHFELPEALIAADMKLSAKPKKEGPLFGFFDDMAKVKRRYSVRIKGLTGDVTIRLATSEGRVSVLDTRVANPELGELKIRLTRDDDGLVSSFLNDLMGGEIDRMIKSTIRTQLTGSALARQISDPITRLVQDGAAKLPPSMELKADAALAPNVVRLLFPYPEGGMPFHTEDLVASISEKGEVTDLRGKLHLAGESYSLEGRPDLVMMLNAVLSENLSGSLPPLGGLALQLRAVSAAADVLKCDLLLVP
jgi:hypothetical protein